MTSLQSWLRTGALLAVAGCACFCLWRISVAADTAHVALWNISSVAYNAQPTLQHVNDATGVWSKASEEQAAAADELLNDLRAQSWHLDRTFVNLNAQMDHVGPLLDSLRAESDELRNTTRSATGLLDEAQTTTKAAQPLLASLQRNSDDINGVIRENSPSLHLILDNGAETTKNVAGITGSLDKMGAHLEKTVDTPKPLWKTAIPMAETAGKLYTCFVYHVCIS